MKLPKSWKNLWRLYGLTEEKYRELLERQGFACKICLVPNNKQLLHVDHDHKTKLIRGLLCRQCNTMIGLAHENTTIMLRGIQYLKRRLK